MSGWQALADEEGFVVVRPNGFGTLRSWNGGDGCCGAAQSQNLDDVGLMKAIVAELNGTLCIDPRRVYASGLRNGGALSHRIACEAADVFAAVAAVSHPLDFKPYTKCQPSRPIAVIQSDGLDDIIVPYSGGFTTPPVRETARPTRRPPSLRQRPALHPERGQRDGHPHRRGGDTRRLQGVAVAARRRDAGTERWPPVQANPTSRSVDAHLPDDARMMRCFSLVTP